MITIKASGRNAKVLLPIEHGQKNTELGIKNGLYDMGVIVRRYLRKEIRRKDTKSGVKYSNLPNQSSAAGEFPANQSGDLAKSAGFSVRGTRQMEFGTDTDYAEYLEDGTSKMAARPHVKRTANEKEGEFAQVLQNSIDRANKF